MLSSAITIIFWAFVARWAVRRKKRIPGRVFEYLFFLFLFFASYFLTWAASGVMQGPELLSRLSFMIVCIISAIYTGYFHYIMELHN
jgi:hypothetical protein